MSQQNKLRAMIDRMVADSIRRVLPTVMNEVLLQTIVNSGVLSERGTATSPVRPLRKKPGPKPKLKRQIVERREVRSSKAVPTISPTVKKNRTPNLSSLSKLLDETAGAEFYGNSNSHEVDADEYEVDLNDDADVITTTAVTATATRQSFLNPALRALAADVHIPDDDEGGMWQSGEHDVSIPTTAISSVRDIDRAAASIGIDFGRMSATLAKTAPKLKLDQDDIRSRAVFEERRLRKMREQLNEGKPVE